MVGLGPARADLILPAARSAIELASRRFVRTARHPAVDDLARDGIHFESFDEIYEREDQIEQVYDAIVVALLEARCDGDVVYAVPGSPVVAERTVALLRERTDELTIIPGLSFAELAWTHLGVDPLAGARVIDARAFDIECAGKGGALLIAQTDSQFVLSDVKLALLETLDADHDVVVLQRLGLDDECVQRISLEDLDRVIVADHLTSVFIDTGALDVASEFARLWQLTLRLRGPGGCPWDAQQTHHSLARHTLEEAYEVIEAIDRLPIDAPGGETEPIDGSYEHLEDELGDMLFQVMIHAALAVEVGAFTVADVARGVHDKLVHRHPHVFGDASVDSADDVVRNWETIKKAEQGHESLVDGLPDALPALLYTPKLYRKMKVVGLDPAANDPAAWLRGVLQSIVDEEQHDVRSMIGEALAAIVAFARARDIDPESALRGYAARMKEDFRAIEIRAKATGQSLEDCDTATINSWWEQQRSIS